MAKVTLELDAETALKLKLLHEVRQGPYPQLDGIVHGLSDVVEAGIDAKVGQLTTHQWHRYHNMKEDHGY